MHQPFTIRDAQPADHADFVRLFAELKTGDRRADSERWVADVMPDTFFLEEDGRKVAYAYVMLLGELGYVCHVVVDAPARGRGVGRALMRVIADRLREKRCTRWELNVKPDNLPAVRLYESVGMHKQYESTVVRIDWDDALRLPLESGVAVHEIDPSEDDEIERNLHLAEGKILRLREMTGQLLVQLVDEAGVRRGFARFDPDFPGAA